MPSTAVNKISAVVVTYRTGATLAGALAALLADRAIAELIVVDNGNPPADEAMLRQVAASDGRVRLISGHGNIGFAAACNLGAARAGSELLLLINPDVVPAPGLIDRLLAESVCLRRPWLLGPRLVNDDGSEQRGGRRQLLTPGNALVEALGLHRLWPAVFASRRLNRHRAPVPAETTEVPAISGACMLMPLADYRAIGGMDENYFLHVEDLDFCLRFRQAGGTIHFCPAVELKHQQGSSDASSLFVEWQKVRSCFYYFRRHFSGRAFPGLVPLVQVGTLVRFGLVATLGLVRSLGR